MDISICYFIFGGSFDYTNAEIEKCADLCKAVEHAQFLVRKGELADLGPKGLDKLMIPQNNDSFTIFPYSRNTVGGTELNKKFTQMLIQIREYIIFNIEDSCINVSEEINLIVDRFFSSFIKTNDLLREKTI